ncbi:FHA domain-containing protein [Verrucomicrobiales bacterium]|nr:FHA domain-containing protein [Verrucomicrobiales bacterium]MDB4358791.1 FHA domain-containing protein [Verrucomicrobiales bacterium]
MALCLKPVNPVSFPLGVIQIPEGGKGVFLGWDSGHGAQVDVDAVSSRHAQLVFNSEGGLELNDCESSNGTFVNNVRIRKHELVEGDVVMLASAAFNVVEFDRQEVSDSSSTKSIPLPSSSETGRPEPTAPQPFVSAPAGPSEAEVAARAEISALKASAEVINAELRATKRDLAEATDRESRTRSQLDSTRQELLQKERDIAALTYEVSQRDGNLDHLQASADQMGDELAQLKIAHSETSNALELKSSALMVAMQRADSADSSRAALFAQTNAFLERLEDDWKAWIGTRPIEADESGDEVDVVFARTEKVAEAIRSELDLIEPIWHEYGDGVQNELQRRCSNLEDERLDLERRKNEQLSLHQQSTEDLEEIRAKVDNEVRRAQSLSRKGTEVAIPERFESMVIANDREQEIFRLLIERIDELDGLVESYSKSKKYRDIYLDLTAFQDNLSIVLSENGVTPFFVEKGTMLTPKLRKEVQILVKKGWGTKEFMEQPFRRGEVKEVVRHGYRVAEGEHFEILRKVEVLVREVGD